MVIDEIQLLNLVDSPHASLMQLFLLNLVNSGIPLVLVGNPSGFAWLPAYSQNLARSEERPSFFFHPCGSVDSPEQDDWNSVFVGVSSFYLLDEIPEDMPACSALLKRCSGGIPRYALALWCSAQVNVLHDGRHQMTLGDLHAVYDSDSFSEARCLCDGFATRDPTLLMKWRDTDVPVDFYAKKWGCPIGPDVSEGHDQMTDRHPHRASTTVPVATSAPTSPEGIKKSRPRSAKSKFKAAQTRERNEQIRREELNASLSEEDMRREGIKMHTLASFNELMKQIDGGKSS